MTHPIYSGKFDHRLAELLPKVELYSGLELVMSQPGSPTLAVFLKPAQALALAETLIAEARHELARKEAGA